MRLLLIRHGQTPANVRGALETSQPGPHLTELGREQAAAVPAVLAEEKIAGIYVSRLIRTRETAAPLARMNGEMHRVELPGIHEIEAGALEGHTDKLSVKKYLETAWSWGSGDLDVRMPGAHDGHEFYGRFDADIAHIAQQHDPSATVAVFSHGAAIRVWVAARATNIAPEFAGKRELDNTGIVTLDGSPQRGWTLVSWQGEPLGGATLEDRAAIDVTGDPIG